MLVHAWVTDTGSLMDQSKVPERGFILGTPLKNYHFVAPTVEEKNVWFQELQSRIFTQKRLFNEVSVNDWFYLHVLRLLLAAAVTFEYSG